MSATIATRIQKIRSAARAGRQYAATRPLPTYLLAQTVAEASASVQAWQGRRQAAMVDAMRAETPADVASALDRVQATTAEVDMAYRVVAFVR